MTVRGKNLQTCQHIWILPFHNIRYSVTNHLVQWDRDLVEETAKYYNFSYRQICCYLFVAAVKDIRYHPSYNTGHTLAKRQAGNTHFEQITMVIHHEQNHQVHLSFGESSAVDNGTWERPFHCHSVLNLGELSRVSKKPAKMYRLPQVTPLALTSLCSLTSSGLAATDMNLRSRRSSSLLRESCSFRLSWSASTACSRFPFTVDKAQRLH